MKIERGEIWLANLDPTQGSEQAGTRPIIIFKTAHYLNLRQPLSPFLSQPTYEGQPYQPV